MCAEVYAEVYDEVYDEVYEVHDEGEAVEAIRRGGGGS